MVLTMKVNHFRFKLLTVFLTTGLSECDLTHKKWLTSCSNQIVNLDAIFSRYGSCLGGARRPQWEAISQKRSESFFLSQKFLGFLLLRVNRHFLCVCPLLINSQWFKPTAGSDPMPPGLKARTGAKEKLNVSASAEVWVKYGGEILHTGVWQTNGTFPIDDTLIMKMSLCFSFEWMYFIGL